MITAFITKRDIEYPKFNNPKIKLLVKKGSRFNLLTVDYEKSRKEKDPVYTHIYRYDEKKKYSEENCEIISGRKSSLEKESHLYKPVEEK